MAISQAEIRRAEKCMEETLRSVPRAVSARYDRPGSRIVIALSSGIDLAFPPRIAQGLENAKPADLMDIEISPSGLGLHFPRLDADLYLPALLSGVLGSPAWMAGLMGREGGRATTAAKRAASRENGKLGGRPRRKVS